MTALEQVQSLGTQSLSVTKYVYLDPLKEVQTSTRMNMQVDNLSLSLQIVEVGYNAVIDDVTASALIEEGLKIGTSTV